MVVANSSKTRRSKTPARRGTIQGKLRAPGRDGYPQEFKEVVVAYAFRQTIEEAADYFGLSVRAVTKWVNYAKDINYQADNAKILPANPYRGTAYTLQKRIQLSDKLFAETELAVEVERIRNGGSLDPTTLQKLATVYAILTDKRRLEEGAHTHLVGEAKDPDEIAKDGKARVVEFQRRFQLPAASGGSGE